MEDENIKLFFETNQKDFYEKLPCLGMSCAVCYFRPKGSLYSSNDLSCKQKLKESWTVFSRRQKLEKLLS